MSDLDEARDLLARWAAGKVTDPDVWAQVGPRLLAGLVAETERRAKFSDFYERRGERFRLERNEARGRLLAAEGSSKPPATSPGMAAMDPLRTADQETPE